MNPAEPIPIHGLTQEALVTCWSGLGLPAFRARQVWSWLYVHNAQDWNAMTNLPENLRNRLAEKFTLFRLTPAGTAGDPGRTCKLLLRLADNEHIEAVVIPAGKRLTVCVSTQVGCRWHCAFCASGQKGVIRSLEPDEIVGQFTQAWRIAGVKPTHVVFMGIGEPFDNYDAVLTAVRILNDADGVNLAARRITISTAGVVPGIERLAGEGLQVELSVSLHAPNDTLRSRLMPINRRWPLDQLLAACRAYTEQTGRIITFEYTLIGGVNDSESCARELARLLSTLSCRVNLIPLSAVDEYSGRPASRSTAGSFIRILKRKGVNATLRASRGGGVEAACGQLRARIVR